MAKRLAAALSQLWESERLAALRSLSFQLQRVLDAADSVEEEEEGTASSSSSPSPLNKLSERLRTKIGALAAVYERDQRALERILRPFRLDDGDGFDPWQDGSNRGGEGNGWEGGSQRSCPGEPRSSPRPNASSIPCSPPLMGSGLSIEDEDGSRSYERALVPVLAPFSPGRETATALSSSWTYYASPTACGSSPFSSPAPGDPSSSSSAVYGSAAQALAHLVRDWSPDGAGIRRSLYGWCGQKVRDGLSRLRDGAVTGEDVSILVPGSGAGRLAYELATVTAAAAASDDDGGGGEAGPPRLRVHVHAAEPSLTMVAAAAHLFGRSEPAPGAGGCDEEEGEDAGGDRDRIVLHPYASDPFTNEVDEEEEEGGGFSDDDDDDPVVREIRRSRRFRAVTIERPSFASPPDPPPAGSSNPASASASAPSSLTFLLSDFESVADAHLLRRHQSNATAARPPSPYQFVVTCYFLDTATNVLDHLRRIALLLPAGGVWVNAGPVQWHRNAVVALTTRELRIAVEAAGFEVLEWKVDAEPLEYRSSTATTSRGSGSGTTTTTSTRVEAHYPLRFVARRKGR
jgi:hypothetical protein